jgi:hypothetical protein
MEKDTITITFTGDLCCNNHFADALQKKKEILTENLKYTLAQSDYIIYNFEGCALSSDVVSKKNYPVHNSPDIIPYLKSFGNPVLNLANNHTMDYGSLGLSETITHLNLNNIKYFGADLLPETAINPIKITTHNTIINIWGITTDSFQNTSQRKPGTCGLSTLNKIGRYIKCQKTKEINIFCLHGGEEYTLYPMPFKRDWILKLAKKYAPDVIISHHSHTIQGIERLNNTLIFYSLGNFMFDYEPHKLYEGTDTGLLVTLQINKEWIDYSLNGIKINTDEPLVDLFELQKISDFDEKLSLKNYHDYYLKDAYRVVFGSKALPGFNKNASLKTSLFKKISIKNFKLLWGIISDRTLFSLYFSALKYKLLKNDH